MKQLSLGYSPCPNDTFIFYALVHGKIDTGGHSFNEELLDVETLNQKALNAELDVTKISYAAYGRLRDNYTLLRSGGAVGRGCGPLIVAKRNYSLEQLRNRRIAIPGRLTTAFLLLRLYDPEFARFVEMPFHKIMDAVASEEVDAGLIIHESRFTYPSYRLKKIMDLGEWWERETGLPIPLGGIIARRSLGESVIKQIGVLIKQSVEYAFSNPTVPMAYIKKHSQELSDDVINQHIDLYVNDFSIDLGEEGEKAVREFIKRAEDSGIIPKSHMPVFT
ncbi:MAG: 1,4-dihydroxy-6-naphthoate synthase [Nitrospiraceae bacterium]|nr:MAG: 1,4-dihydroxy-6-naphthoate synthase [Nitrospiraceae bacterium]